MRILLIGNQAESLLRFRRDLGLEWRALGHEVHFAAPEPLPPDPPFPFHSFPLQRTGLNPFADLRTFLHLVSLLRSLRPEILFCFTIKPVIYGSLAARFCEGVSCYSMITGTGSLFDKGSFFHRSLRSVVSIPYRAALGAAKAVFFQNREDQACFTQAGLLREGTKAVLIPGSGVNLKEYPFVAPKTKPVRFLYMGRLLREKGVEVFAQAAKILKSRYPKAVFEVLGPLDENPGSIGRGELETWKRTGAVRYLGSWKDVRPFLARCSVFVLPTYYREGVPRSILEALSTGRPILTTDHPGCRETVTEGKNGFLIPPKDAGALARAMEKFLKDPKKVPRMGRASRALAQKKFDVRLVNRIILKAMGMR